MHALDPHIVSQGVVIHIARDNDAAAHIDRTQPRTVAAEAVFAKHPVAWVMGDALGFAQPQLECRQRHKWLVGGAWRIQAFQGAVEQRFVDGFIERAPVLYIDAIDKEIGVKSGLADQGQNLTIAGVYGHQCAAPIAKHVLDQFLQFDVYRQHHIAARFGRNRAEQTQGAPACRGFHLLDPCGAVQQLFIALFYAQLADVVCAFVIGLHLRLHFGDGFFFFLVDAADIAHHMGGGFIQRIAAKQARLHIHSSKAVALRGKARHFLLGEARAQGDGFKASGFGFEFFKAFDVTRINAHDAAQLGNQIV